MLTDAERATKAAEKEALLTLMRSLEKEIEQSIDSFNDKMKAEWKPIKKKVMDFNKLLREAVKWAHDNGHEDNIGFLTVERARIKEPGAVVTHNAAVFHGYGSSPPPWAPQCSLNDIVTTFNRLAVGEGWSEDSE